MTLGERVKQKRTALGWSQAELARRVSKILRRKVTQVAIHHIESRGNVSPRFVVELAQALGVSLSWLQHGHERPVTIGKDPPNDVFANHSSNLIELLMNEIYDPDSMPKGSAEAEAVLILAAHLSRKH